MPLLNVDEKSKYSKNHYTFAISEICVLFYYDKFPVLAVQLAEFCGLLFLEEIIKVSVWFQGLILAPQLFQRESQSEQ